MANNVEYTLSLKDLLTSKLKEAHAESDSLERGMESLSDTIKEVGVAMGIAFGIEKIFEVGKEILNVTAEFEGYANRIKFASENTADATLNMAFLNDEVARLHLPMKEVNEQFSEMQAGLVGTGIEGAKLRTLFDGISTAAATLHLGPYQLQRTMYDLKEIGEIGLNARIEKSLATALPGINDIVKKTFGKTMHELNGTISGPDFLSKLGPALKERFEGGLANWSESLQAKQNDLNNDIVREQLDLGDRLRPAYIAIMEGLMSILDAVKPALTEVANGITTLTEYLKDSTDGLKAFGVAIGVAITGLIAYNGYQLAMAAQSGIATLATFAEMVAVDGLSAALYAAGIVGATAWALMTGGISLVVAGLYYLYEKTESVHGVIWGLYAAIKEFYTLVYEDAAGLYHILHGIFKFDLAEIKGGMSEMANVYLDGFQRVGKAAVEGYNSGVADFGQKQSLSAKVKGAKGESGATGGHGDNGAATIASPSKATGTHSTTVNVTVNGGLIHSLTFHTTHLAETLDKTEQAVTNVIMKAVNQGQLIAG